LPLAAFFLLGSLAGFWYLHATSRGIAAPDERAGSVLPGWVDPMSIFDGDRALLSPGSIVTLGVAAAAVGRKVYLPTELTGVPTSDPEVWLSRPTNDVGLRYGSDLVIVQTEWQPGTNPSNLYASRAEESKVGEATIIGGYDAFVVLPHEQAPGFPPFSVVLLSIEGTQVAMYGDMPIEQLILIAESVKPASA